VKKDWKAALKTDLQVARFKRKGEYAHGPAGAARSAWNRVATSMERYDAAMAGWQMAKAALELFRPDGQLNDRAWAEAGLSRGYSPWRARRGRRSGTCCRPMSPSPSSISSMHG
jgi:hypothetical protein